MKDFFLNTNQKFVYGGTKIEFLKKCYFINEDFNSLIEFSYNKNIKINKRKIYVPKQSDLTNKLINNIINKNIIDLPTLRESFINHKIFLEAFSKELLKFDSKYKKNLPLT